MGALREGFPSSGSFEVGDSAPDLWPSAAAEQTFFSRSPLFHSVRGQPETERDRERERGVGMNVKHLSVGKE